MSFQIEYLINGYIHTKKKKSLINSIVGMWISNFFNRRFVERVFYIFMIAKFELLNISLSQ